MSLPYTVYILRCSDGRYYVGCTKDLDERLARHAKGLVQYTSSRLPLECVCTIAFTDKYRAFAFEKYLKTGSGRAFMARHLI